MKKSTLYRNFLEIWNCWCQLFHRRELWRSLYDLGILKSASAKGDVPMYQAPTAPMAPTQLRLLFQFSSFQLLNWGYTRLPLHDTVLLIYRITTWESALDDYSDRVYWDAWTAQLKIEIDRADDLQNHWFVRSWILK